MVSARLKKPAVVQELRAHGHVVLEASAGTGKTFALEHIVLDLVLSGTAALSQILLVTFTEKAANELKIRVRAKLGEILSLPDAPESESVDDASCWTITPAAKDRVREALRAFDSAPIFTLHAFCRRVLSDFAFDSHRKLEEEAVDGKRVFTAAFHEALRDTFAADEPYRGLLEFALAHGESVEGIEDNLISAWSSRARTAPSWNVESAGPLLDEFLATAEATLAALPGVKGANSRSLATLAKNIEALLTEASKLTNLPKQLAAIGVLNAIDSIDDFASRAEKLAPANEKLGLFWAQMGLFIETVPDTTGALCSLFLPAIEERMSRVKREQGLFDFDDMLSLTNAAIHGPGGEVLVEALRARYRVALIDEFQDTDPLQWSIFRKLFVDGAKAERLFVVGDPKQAIYGFRAADVNTYLAAVEELRAGGAQVLSLRENFRSSPALVAAYNTLLAPSENPPFFTGDNQYRTPVVAARAPFALEVSGEALAPCVILDASRETLSARPLRSHLAEAIATEIATLLRDGATVARDGTSHRLLPNDIFVLAHNHAEERVVGDALRHARVPFAFYKQAGLFETGEALDLAVLLRAIAEPTRDAYVMSALLTPYFAVDFDDVVRVRRGELAHPAREILSELHRLATRRHYGALMSAIVESTGIARRALLFGDERSLTNTEHLLEVLHREALRESPSANELAVLFQSFVDGTRKPLGEGTDLQRLESDAHAVQVMTMHSSKGLEAEVVFLFGGYTTNPKFKNRTFRESGERKQWYGAAYQPRKDAARKELREERERLGYVALTRAKSRLYVSFVNLEGGARKRDGAHVPIDTRLSALLDAPYDETLFEHRVLAPYQVHSSDSASRDQAASASLRPAISCDVASYERAVANDVARAGALLETRKGPFFTSYSRISQRLMLHAKDVTADDRSVEAQPPPDIDLAPLSTFPAGIGPGLCLHAILEHVDVEKVRTAPSIEALLQDEATATLIARECETHGIDAAHHAEAGTLLYSALRSPIDLLSTELSGIANASALLRETEFVYPIPEHAHPPLGSLITGERPFRVERGFVKGFIDLIFEHEKRAYVLDWKSDRLPHYGNEMLVPHVRVHYEIQARLYAVALGRMLQLRTERDHEERFGGLVYAFLRGMKSKNSGVYTFRPTWRELQQWESALVEQEVWG